VRSTLALKVLAGVCLLGCEGTGPPPMSEGSRFAELRSWEVATDNGLPTPEWIVPGELAPDVLSVTLVAETNLPLSLSFEVHDAADRLLVDPARPAWSPNRALPMRGVATAMLPSASGTLPLGRNFRVTAFLGELLPGATVPRLTAFAKRPLADGGPVPAFQDLPIAVVVVGDKPPAQARLDGALAELAGIWSTAGVQIRVLAQRRMTGPEVARFDRLVLDRTQGSDSPELGRLLALSESLRDLGEGLLPVFLVPDITVDQGPSVWAVSGGIPVPPLLGTRRSGVAVNASVVDLDPGRAGQVMAHEIGHALGLYHTTEGSFAQPDASSAAVAINDQLDDTPACPRQADRDGDGALSPAECAGFDARNLMFWTATRSARTLTGNQADIARRSALTK
jgi:hypothetical protein